VKQDSAYEICVLKNNLVTRLFFCGAKAIYVLSDSKGDDNIKEINYFVFIFFLVRIKRQIRNSGCLQKMRLDVCYGVDY